VKHPPVANRYRDAWAGDVDATRAGEELGVAGWVHRRRDHGGLIFIDLRDRSGLLQLVFHPETSGAAFAAAERLRPEHVLSARGTLLLREPGNVNPNLPTGEVELQVAELEVLATAETPPFAVDEDGPVDEATRLRHRVIDLRRESMRDALVLRDAITREMRSVLSEVDFLEIETPMLTRSTPEGARDFLVPARLQPGAFYALPQSPQLFKQLLMIGGYERYFQIVRCFRDEDLRADRQPEFTQLDVEMSFVEEDDVMGLMETLMARVFALSAFAIAPPPWPRMTYADAMLHYGTDRPDLRFGMEIHEVSELLRGSEFKVFSSVLEGGGVIRGLNVGPRETPRKELDELTELAQRSGAKGLVWAFVQDGGAWRSPVAKFLSEAEMQAVSSGLGASEGDLLLIVADQAEVAANVLGTLRVRLGEPAAGAEHAPVWIVDFPMFEHDAAEGRWNAIHHPFTAPVGDLDDPGSLLSRGYDLVVDGSELGGGSIRIHDVDVQRRVLEILGMDEEEAQRRFGFLLDALRFGAPPHGGIAFGLDRIVAIMAGRESIRDVIAFPKTASGVDPLTGAPAPVDDKQLRELGLKLL
jgi:aspartyl-tRNA synthetase